MKQKDSLKLVVIFLVAIIIFCIVSYTFSERVIGGERDEHSCLGAAGYSWNETEKVCVREWAQDDKNKYQVDNFYSCANAGYPIMESYPRQCRAPNGETFVEEIEERTFCTEEQRNADACVEIYQPVCGWSDPEKVQCIKYPCASTYSNSCFSCMEENVLYWTEGECED